MFLRRVHSEGLAHVSYIIGDGSEAVVIDPRRDCDVYVEIAAEKGARISHIFETHRNEDYIIGSCDLARLTGAEIYHGAALDFEYGNAVSEGDVFNVGDMNLTVLETPGHTYESISIVLRDKSFGDDPLAVFTGDALFIGDVGRTDFFPDRAEEVAGLLYDSIFEKLLPLGDHVLLYPAHGAGSVCGDSMAEREFSTLGYERRNNDVLQLTDRDDFIRHKVEEVHYKPKYFKCMEKHNLKGAPPLDRLPVPAPATAEAFASAIDDGLQVVDLRSPEAFSGAFVPGSLNLPLEMVPAYGGYILDYDRPIGLVAENAEDVATAVRYLVRMGYEDIPCFLAGGLNSWEITGRDFDKMPAITARELKDRIDEGEPFTLLDVRKETEFKIGHLPRAIHIFLGNLPERLADIPRDKQIVVFCGSGRRASIGGSLLKLNGFERVQNNLGSAEACEEVGCRFERGTEG